MPSSPPREVEILNLVSPHTTVADLKQVDAGGGSGAAGIAAGCPRWLCRGARGSLVRAATPRAPAHNRLLVSLQVYEDRYAVHIVMELCVGGELFERIVAKGTFSEAEAARHFRRMVEMVGACCTGGQGVFGGCEDVPQGDAKGAVRYLHVLAEQQVPAIC